MKRTVIINTIIFLCSTAVYAGNSNLRPIQMTISPSPYFAESEQIRLLPTEEELTDTNAVPLYEKALSLFSEENEQQITQWRSLSPDLLPVEELETLMQQIKPSLDLVVQATKSKQCNWRAFVPGTPSQKVLDDLRIYRQIATAIDIQTKLQIYQGQYDQAIQNIKTNLAMGKHVGQAPTLVEGMVGIAVAALDLNRVEQWIQSDNSTNLYWALKDINLPLVDVSRVMQLEMDNLQNYNILVRSQFRQTLEPAHARVRQQMNFLDRRIAALQCIEALRRYASLNTGQFPDTLTDFNEITFPIDPVTGKPFTYTKTGSAAVLELPGTEGSEDRDAIRYELTFSE